MIQIRSFLNRVCSETFFIMKEVHIGARSAMFYSRINVNVVWVAMSYLFLFRRHENVLDAVDKADDKSHRVS